MEWKELGACRDTYVPGGTDIWYSPENPGGSRATQGILGEKERIAAAKAVCASCGVRSECLEWAIEAKDAWAILGGLTPQERGVR